MPLVIIQGGGQSYRVQHIVIQVKQTNQQSSQPCSTGRNPVPWGFRYDLTENLGFAVYGDRLVDVDAYLTQSCGIDPNKIEHVSLAAEEFGKWTSSIIDEAASDNFYLMHSKPHNQRLLLIISGLG